MRPETDRIPKWLRYCGLNLEVRRAAQDEPGLGSTIENDLGFYQAHRGRITIVDGMHRVRRWVTMFHEFNHEVEERAGRGQLGKDGADEREVLTDMYAWGFLWLLIENPGLQEALIADYRETMREEAEAGAPGVLR